MLIVGLSFVHALQYRKELKRPERPTRYAATYPTCRRRTNIQTGTVSGGRSGSPWENGCCESFNARFRDELLNGEIFYSLKEAQIIIEQWRLHYNTKRPHSALGYSRPAPESNIHMERKRMMHEHSKRTNYWGQARCAKATFSAYWTGRDVGN